MKTWRTTPHVKVIFTGPHTYISPRYYVSEFAVPTWNYSAVSVSGTLAIIEDQTQVLAFLDRLVAQYETSDDPWKLNRDDDRYMKLLSGIVVFAVSLDTVEAKFKINQNKSAEDQNKVIHSLSATQCPFDHSVATMMAQQIEKAS